MALQSTYTAVMPALRPGMIIDMRNRTVISKTIASGTGMAFGAVALRGTSDEAVMNVGDAGAGGYVGISVVDPAVRPGGNNAYSQYDTAGIMRKGPIGVTVASNVTPGAAAYYTSTGALTATSTSNTAIPNATFESTTASGGVAKLVLG